MNKAEYERIDGYMRIHMNQTDPVHGEEITFYISDLDIGDDTFKLNLKDGNKLK